MSGVESLAIFVFLCRKTIWLSTLFLGNPTTFSLCVYTICFDCVAQNEISKKGPGYPRVFVLARSRLNLTAVA